jgi:signal peptidase II
MDQVTKLWAVEVLTGQPSRQIIGELVMFTLVYNEGGAMGTRLGSAGYYTVMALLILPFIIYYLWHNRRVRAISWPLAFILGGALGNLIDRIRLGRVVDFLDIDMPDIKLSFFQLDRWWTFNVADAAITCSIVFLLVHTLLANKGTPAAPTSHIEDPPNSL